jgi:hypothetical protein
MVKYAEKVVIKKDTQTMVQFLTQIEEIKLIFFKNNNKSMVFYSEFIVK